MKRIQVTDPVSTGVMGVAVALLLGLIIFLVVVPRPTVKIATSSGPDPAIAAITKDNKDLAAVHAEIDSHIWNEDPDDIAPQALKIFTDLATKNKITVTSFRPQKEMPADPLQMLPFFAAVQGEFPDMARFTKALQTNPKLALSLLQIASADASTDKVTASIGLVAYIDPSAVDSNATDTTASKTTTAPVAAKTGTTVTKKTTTSKIVNVNMQSGKATAKVK